jgi:hypothetical protein
MKIILGIVIFYILAIISGKISDGKKVLYFSIFFISLLLVGYVVVMMFIMPEPESLL